MLTFVVRRLLLAVPVLLGVVFVVMLTIDLLPGDAVTLMLGEHATKDAVAALREHLGLDKPFAARYVDYVGRLVRGDLARSIQQNRPVAVALALPPVAIVARMPRSAVLDVPGAHYVRTARANGAGEACVLGKHAQRNAFIPILTLLGLQSGQLMGGAVLTETVFAWPGLGRLMVKAIFARDYILLQGAVLVFALAFVIINLIVDLSYGLLDPRIGRQG